METSLYEQLVSILGTPPNDIIMYLYYLILAFLLITIVKLIYIMIFKFILNIKFK